MRIIEIENKGINGKELRAYIILIFFCIDFDMVISI